MASQPAFSRLALAAALMEYDNDPNDRYGENVDHKQSAIFRQLRQRQRPPSIPPLDVGDGRGRGPGDAGHRRQGTMTSYQSGVGVDGDLGDRNAMHEVSVDRWGLPERMLSEDMHTGSRHQSRIAQVPPELARGHSVYVEHLDEEGRPTSVSSYDHMADEALREAERVRRFAEDPSYRRRSGIHDLTLEDTGGNNPIMVLLPESPSSMRHQLPRMERGPARRPAPITLPMDSPGSGPLSGPLSASILSAGGISLHSPSRLDDEAEEEELLRNPFELPAPPPEMGSRFDPKSLDAQRRSIDLTRIGSRGSTDEPRDPRISLNLERPGSFAGTDGGRPGSATGTTDPRMSMYSERRASLVYHDEPSPIERTSVQGDPNRMSTAWTEVSGMERHFDQIPDAADYGKPLQPSKYTSHALRIARHELLRPKTLIMPPPLAGSDRQTIAVHVPHGFSLGEKPLPADARASILNMGKGVPLSLAQRTFRSSLMVGGQRDDEVFFQGTADEGEMLGVHHEEDEEEEEIELHKPGKLYGTSLIDQLEARKAQLHSKRRVFYGDNRPSMMARSTSARQSTLIDPASLAEPPSLPPPNPEGRPTAYVQSQSMPHINVPDVDDDVQASRLAKSRSVFGVDTVWEREMTKLKSMQAAEQKAKEEAEAAERAKEQAKRAKAEKAGNRKSFWGRKSMMLDANSGPLDQRWSVIDRPESMLNPNDPRPQTMLSPNDPRPQTMFNLGSDSQQPTLDPNDPRPNSMLMPNDPRMSMFNPSDPRPDSMLMPNDPRMSMFNPSSPSDARPNSMLMPNDPRMSMFNPGDPRMSIIAQEEDEEDEGQPRPSAVSDRPPTLMFEPEAAPLGSMSPEKPAPPPERRAGSRLGVTDWFQSSDEDSDEDRPLRRVAKDKAAAQPSTMAAVPQSAPVMPPPPQLPPAAMYRGAPNDDDDSSDEDVPLSRIKAQAADDSSDEEVPLSQLRDKGTGIHMVSKKSLTPTLPSVPQLPTIKAVSSTPLALNLPSSGLSPVSPGGANSDDDDEPLFIRQARTRASAMVLNDNASAAGGASGSLADQTKEEIEDDLPLGWKHANAAVRQHAAKKAQPQPQSFYGAGMGGGMPPQSFYGNPYMAGASPYMSGVPMAPPMGHPGMGMMGMGGMGGMGMPMQMPMQGMPGMPMGGQGMYPPMEMPDPGRNIDDWRKQVAPLAPAATGSGQSVSTRGP